MNPINSELLETILRRVEKPGRYTNGELNSIHKNHSDIAVKFVIAYPDLYELGMSNLALQILYNLINKNDSSLCERVFSPAQDLEKELTRCDLPLFSLESKTPLAEFNFLGFCLAYELTYTNILGILKLGKIPFQAKERDEHHPLIFAGGPSVFNPEPIADFFDFFIIGEAEEIIDDLIEVYKKFSKNKAQFLQEIVKFNGVYVPSFYEPIYHQDFTLKQLKPLFDFAPPKINKLFLKKLNGKTIITKPIVPYLNIIFDRAAIEIMRGCGRGCRYCQADFTMRPRREVAMEDVIGGADVLLANTGYEELSLLSLSTSDYPNIEALAERILQKFASQKISLTMPSMRSDSFSVKLAASLQKVRKTGVTLAPEAGTQRLRNVINKGITEEEIISAAQAAYENGVRTIKLYFMIGLPTETDEDLQSLVDLVYKIMGRDRSRRVVVNITTFVPKPHTPFQWEVMINFKEIEEKINFLKKSFKHRQVNLRWTDPEISILEGLLSRGDRKITKVIETAFNYGCLFDSWSEHFKYHLWEKSFAENNLDLGFYLFRQRSDDEILPWDHISTGVSKDFLIAESRKAKRAETTASCQEKCSVCGISVCL